MIEKKKTEIQKFEPIAIVGLANLFPESNEKEEFWRNILSGKDLLTEVPSSHWRTQEYYDANSNSVGKTYSKRGAFIPDTKFDPLEHSIPPNFLFSIDSAQLLSLVVTKKLLQDIGLINLEKIDSKRISVILGHIMSTGSTAKMISSLDRPLWENTLRENGIPESIIQKICAEAIAKLPTWNESTFPGFLSSVVAGRISNRFDLGGKNLVVDGACASSLAAIDLAIQELHLGKSDVVITGGVDTYNGILSYVSFCKTQAMSPTDDCRPFSARADGTVLGEGIGMIALRLLKDAEKDGNKIYAVIKGLGASSDGRAKSVFAPRVEGQMLALSRAYQAANYSPSTVDLVEAHGTGTMAGDLAEFESLCNVFSGTDQRRQWCALGSVKSQIGHTKAAAGVASIIKAIMALQHQILPPTIKVEQPNPALAIEKSPFFLNTKPQPWIRGKNHPRRASVSSFGFGGVNFHVALEEYCVDQKQVKRFCNFPAELFLFSNNDLNSFSKSIKKTSLGININNFSFEAQKSQKVFLPKESFRLATVAKDFEALKNQIDFFLSQLSGEIDDIALRKNNLYFNSKSPKFDESHLAFLFPGQGSQYGDMGKDLALNFKCYLDAWNQSEDLLDFSEKKLSEVVFQREYFNDSENNIQSNFLTQTQWAQPALAVTAAGYINLAKTLNLFPKFVGGHSFGELSALYCAGVLSLKDFFGLAKIRGSLMAASSKQGGSGSMLAVFATEAQIEKTLSSEQFLNVVIANKNAPEQFVVSGDSLQILQIQSLFKEQNILSVLLNVSCAFHSPFVKEALVPFENKINETTFENPKMMAFSNVTGERYSNSFNLIQNNLSKQLISPVLFKKQITSMFEAGARIFVEIGPNNVLSDLVKKNLSGEEILIISLDRKGENSVTTLWHALGQLAINGIELNFEALWQDYSAEELEKVQYSEATVLLNGAGIVGAKQSSKVKQNALTKNSQENEFEKQFTDLQKKNVELYLTTQKAIFETHQSFQETLKQMREQPLTFANKNFTHLLKTPTTSYKDENVDNAKIENVIEEKKESIKPDFGKKIMEIIAEKTGYTLSMLKPTMNLESDLGIDSIKRIEILSAVEQTLPKTIKFEIAKISNLKTIEKLVDYFKTVTAPQEPEIIKKNIVRGVLEEFEIRPLTAKASSENRSKKIFIIEDQGGVSKALYDLFYHNGFSPELGSIPPQNTDILLCLSGLSQFSSPQTAIENNLVFFSQIAELRSHFAQTGGIIIALQDSGGNFLASKFNNNNWNYGFSGFLRTVAREWKNVKTKTIDINTKEISDSDIAQIIWQEFCEEDYVKEVGINKSKRITLLPKIAELAKTNSAPSKFFTQKQHILVSGGGRGITATCLKKLCQNLVTPDVTILGRSILFSESNLTAGVNTKNELIQLLSSEDEKNSVVRAPAEILKIVQTILDTREIKQNISVLQSMGARVSYHQIDIRKNLELEKIVSQVRSQKGPITALIHGAGLLSDKLILEKTTEQFKTVFDTKVVGFLNLLHITQNDPVKLICIFSSIASKTGNVGQCDYAMANEVLNRIAVFEGQRRNINSECMVRSMIWGPWDGGMVDATLKRHFEAHGVGVLDSESAAEAMVNEFKFFDPGLRNIEVIFLADSKNFNSEKPL